MANLRDSHLICTACGTQYDAQERDSLKNCRICDDPRQFVPPSGQSFTTLTDMAGRYRNRWQKDRTNDHIWSLWTEPKFGIGQRALLIKSDGGNVLWDLIAYLDQETVDFINSMGGLEAIVISHPHYYTTHLVWARTFNCTVYLAEEDRSWLSRAITPDTSRTFLTEPSHQVVPGVTAIKCGGHFEGSLVLHWQDHLFIADTFNIVPSGFSPGGRAPGRTSFSFMWSIPNMIPLAPHDLQKIWRALEPFRFESVHGAFVDLDIRASDAKRRVLESMKIQIKAEGHPVHPMLDISLE